MVRMHATCVANDGKAVPPVISMRGRARGRAKAPDRGRIIAARGRAPIGARRHTKAVSADPDVDQMKD